MTLNLWGGGVFVIITNLEIITIMCKISTSYGVILLMGGRGGEHGAYFCYFTFRLFFYFFYFSIFNFYFFC